MIRGIGINCDDEGIDGHLARLEQDLERARQAGFDAYELSLVACNVIRGGQVDREELARLKAVLARWPLHYTVHPPCSLRLTDQTGFHQQVFASCLDVAAHIGADVMVYHSAQIALRPADQDAGPLPDADDLAESWRYETAQLKKLVRQAERLGVTVAIENRDPHLWELAALARHGKGAQELLTYHQGMRLDLLAKQVEEIGSPSLGLCLDVGHAFLAAPYWATDFVFAIRQAARCVRHVHFHDNYGRLDDVAESLAERLAFGEADNHAPPGWGKLPLDQVLTTLLQAGYEGWLIAELRPRYFEDLPQVARSMREMLQPK